MSYLAWGEKVITDLADETISSLYNEGYVFTRLGRGVMHRTRSLRVNLSRFELSSENRRVLRKLSDLRLQTQSLPLPEYDWNIGKMAKDFYDTKFGRGTFSANKVKELLTDGGKSNFNLLLSYCYQPPLAPPFQVGDKVDALGFAICYTSPDILHYCYPFYQMQNIGMAMMLLAILNTKKNGKRYIYLGSAQRPTDTYKLQFKGLEWWDGKKWQDDMDALKKLLKEAV